MATVARRLRKLGGHRGSHATGKGGVGNGSTGLQFGLLAFVDGLPRCELRSFNARVIGVIG